MVKDVIFLKRVWDQVGPENIIFLLNVDNNGEINTHCVDFWFSLIFKSDG